MDVLVDRDRASVVESAIGRCRDAVRPRTTLPGSPRQEQVVNFRTLAPRRSAPADLKKDANGFDLPIALGLLLASGQVAFDRPGNYAIVGELALTGETRPIKGILSMALQRWRVINRRTLTTGDRMGIGIEGESSWNSSRSRDLPGLPPLPSVALMG